MNSTDRLAAKRYAAAFNQLSSTTQDAVSRAQELALAAQALAEVPAFTAPGITPDKQTQVLQVALKKMPQVAAFVDVLVKAKRFTLLPEIVKEVQALTDARRHILRAQVTSAGELPAEEKKHIEDVLSSRYGQTVEAVFQTDKNLLGGLKIYCNGELVDGSLQGQLNRLEEELLK